MCCLLALLAGGPLLLRRWFGAPPAMGACRHAGPASIAGRPAAATIAAGLAIGAVAAMAVAAGQALWPELAALHAPICRALVPLAQAATGR